MGNASYRLTRASDMVGFTGFAGSGKDEACKILEAAGYNRVSMGDIIKRRLHTASPLSLLAVILWMVCNRTKWVEFCSVCQAIKILRVDMVDVYETDLAVKNKFRPLLEWYGMCYYDSILRELIENIRLPVYCNRIMRVEEATAWRDGGGILIEILRPGSEAATRFEGEQIFSLLNGGLIDYTLLNDGTTQELWDKVLCCTNPAT